MAYVILNAGIHRKQFCIALDSYRSQKINLKVKICQVYFFAFEVEKLIMGLHVF